MGCGVCQEGEQAEVAVPSVHRQQLPARRQGSSSQARRQNSSSQLEGRTAAAS